MKRKRQAQDVPAPAQGLILGNEVFDPLFHCLQLAIDLIQALFVVTFQQVDRHCIAPVFDANGIAAGTVSVVAPARRITAKLRATAIRALLRTSPMVTFDTGGRVPVRFDRARARTLDALEA